MSHPLGHLIEVQEQAAGRDERTEQRYGGNIVHVEAHSHFHVKGRKREKRLFKRELSDLREHEP